MYHPVNDLVLDLREFESDSCVLFDWTSFSNTMEAYETRKERACYVSNFPSMPIWPGAALVKRIKKTRVAQKPEKGSWTEGVVGEAGYKSCMVEEYE